MTRRRPVERVTDLVIGVPRSFVAMACELVPIDVGRIERGVRGVRSAVSRNRDLLRRYGVRGALPLPATSVPVPRAPTPIGSVRTVTERPEPPVAQAPARPDPPVDIAADTLPIDGYDQLSARQIVDRLGELSSAELSLVAAHERANRRRQTVLARIEQLA